MPIIALENNAIKARNAEKQQILKGLEQEIVLSKKVLDGLKQLNGLKKQKISMKPRLEPQNKLIQPRKQKYVQNHQTSRKSLRAQISAI